MSGAQVTCKQKVEKDHKTLAFEKFLELKWHQSSLSKKKKKKKKGENSLWKRTALFQSPSTLQTKVLFSVINITANVATS